MKNKHYKIKLITSVIFAACLMAQTAFGSIYPGPGAVNQREVILDSETLGIEDETSQLVLVEGVDGSKVTVTYYEKDQGQWKEIFSTPGVYGKNGGTGEKKEGDGKTPLGVYSFTMAFGLKDDPGSVLPYHKIQNGDYWVDDSESQYYNQLVNTNVTKKAWDSAENMSAQAPYYNLGLVLDYNSDCVPGKGSAIFLHCTKSDADTGSAGCIRIPEDHVKTLVQSVGNDTKIVIISN